MQMIVQLSSADFTSFAFTYFVNLVLMVVERLYLDPILKYIAISWPKWKMAIIRKTSIRKRRTRIEKQEEEVRWRKLIESIEMRFEGVDRLVDAFSVQSVGTVGCFVGPMIGLFLTLFESETKIPGRYGIEADEVVFYALFSLCMIPWSIAVDVVIFNAQELMSGWKVFDFIAYQRYRFNIRRHRWILGYSQVDGSIFEGMQTIDVLCFSSQYFFLVSLYCLGMFSLVFGVIIVLNAEIYSFFSDPMMPVILIVMSCFCEFVKVVLCGLANLRIQFIGYRGLWALQKFDSVVDADVSAKLAIGAGRQIDQEQERIEMEAMEKDEFRLRFLQRNKPWILEHLIDVMSPETMDLKGPNDQQVREYAKETLSSLIDLAPGKKKKKYDKNEQNDGISDDDSDDEVQRRRQWQKPDVTDGKWSITTLWLQKARKRRLFGQIADEMVERQKQRLCSICSRTKAMCKDLYVGFEKDGRLNKSGVDEMIEKFEEKYSVNESDDDLWRAFVRKEATFITCCNICLDHVGATKRAQPKAKAGTVRVLRPGDISSDDESDTAPQPLENSLQKLKESTALRKWRDAARNSVVGGKEMPAVVSAETVKYLQNLAKRRKKQEVHRPMSLRGTLTGKLNEDDRHEEKFDAVNLTDIQKNVMVQWSANAKEVAFEKLRSNTISLQEQLTEKMHKITPEEDWYYSQETRLEGENLVKEGSLHSRDVEDKDANTYAEYKKPISRELADTLARLNRSYENDVIRLNKEMEEQKEIRAQELRRLIRTTKEKHELEILNFSGPEIEAAVIRKQQMSILTDIESTIAAEEKKFMDKLVQRLEVLKKEFKQDESNINSSFAKQSQTEGVVTDPYRELKAWNAKAMLWLARINRRIMAKETEDQKQFELKAHRNKLRRQRKR